jgi:putative FmdB family regulatory protein
MPIYEFRCEECGHVVEALRRMGQGPEGLTCPECGSDELAQTYSAFSGISSPSPAGPACGSGGPGCAPGGG